jgi:hypothetical protein
VRKVLDHEPGCFYLAVLNRKKILENGGNKFQGRKNRNGKGMKYPAPALARTLRTRRRAEAFSLSRPEFRAGFFNPASFPELNGPASLAGAGKKPLRRAVRL